MFYAAAATVVVPTVAAVASAVNDLALGLRICSVDVHVTDHCPSWEGD